MDYCTISDGIAIDAPPTLTDEQGRVHYHPPDDMYSAQGYLRKVYTDPPVQAEDDTTVYGYSWVQDGSNAVQTWAVVEPVQITPTPTTEDRLASAEAAITALTGV